MCSLPEAKAVAHVSELGPLLHTGLQATIAHQSGALLEAESTARTLRLALEVRVVPGA